jgi:hypothetical protein
MDLRKYLENKDGEKYHPVMKNSKHIEGRKARIEGTSSDHSILLKSPKHNK